MIYNDTVNGDVVFKIFDGTGSVGLYQTKRVALGSGPGGGLRVGNEWVRAQMGAESSRNVC
jgi:hypothetical protein